jgi:CRP/FNR family cyclic AMP-dependent transcriptional regulator
MKGLFKLLRLNSKPESGEEQPDSLLFSAAFTEQGVDAKLLVPWEARAVEVGATRLSASHGTRLLQALWAKDPYMHALDLDAIRHLEQFFDFATVAPNCDLIRQDEYGNFMVVLLSGSIAVDRQQHWGERLRLAEVEPGEILGEMSLLDSGQRFSVCTTLTSCAIAVLSADALDSMLAANPTLAASLIALLARKLSLRLRNVSARLSDHK